METAADQDLLDMAQARLLRMREELKVTEPRGLNSLSTGLTEIMQSCRRKSEELRNSGMILFPIAEPEEEPRPVSILSSCGVDRKYRDCTYENFQGGAKLVENIKRLVESGKSIVLSGNTGCGKTHLAVAMMAEFLKTRLDALFVTLPDLLLEIRSSFSERSTNTEKSLVEWCSTKQFMVLDDLGAEKPSEFTVATLYLIFDRRIRQERQTIITTNLMNLDAITEYAGARIASRISEMELINVNMPDYRKRRKDTNQWNQGRP